MKNLLYSTLLSLSMLPVALAPQEASAAVHFMKLVEFFPGTPASPSAQYVVLQMYAAGQNFTNGQSITVYDSNDNVLGTFTFAANVAGSANQTKILIGTAQASSFFSVTPDLIMNNAAILAAGGRICFGATDCVAFGSYAGSAIGVGTPFDAPGPLEAGRAVIRRLDIAGVATNLDAGDDTNDSASDFVYGTPAPRNNGGVNGTVPGSTCGNNNLEGLEQCDDGDMTGGDGCSATCEVELAPAPDAGVADAGAPDSGMADAGGVDIGPPPDAGSSNDAGSVMDAGGSADAGSSLDTGGSADGGASTDAGRTDTGGSNAPDSGAAGDGDGDGDQPADEGGCGCGTAGRGMTDVAGPSAGAGLFVLLLWLTFSRSSGRTRARRG